MKKEYEKPELTVYEELTALTGAFAFSGVPF